MMSTLYTLERINPGFLKEFVHMDGAGFHFGHGKGLKYGSTYNEGAGMGFGHLFGRICGKSSIENTHYYPICLIQYW